MPITGAMSGDALACVERYATGIWILNPNHFLFEVVGAGWQSIISPSFLTALGINRSDPDRLVLLSVLFGSCAVALFRYEAGRFLSANRPVLNYATGAFALSSAFSRMWVNAEHFMIEMPFIVFGVFGALHFIFSRKLSDAVIGGIGIGLATLCMISHVFLAVFIGVGVGIYIALRKRNPADGLRFVVVYGGSAAAIVVSTLFLVWSVVEQSSGSSFVHWLSSYRGGDTTREAMAYGASFSPKALAVAAARSVYGMFSGFVDIQPLIQSVRDSLPVDGKDIVRGVAAAIAALLLLLGLRKCFPDRGIPDGDKREAVLLLSLLIFAATIFFGAWWDNSDDQFYFHIAIVSGLLAGAVLPTVLKKRVIFAALLFVLVFNAIDLAQRFIFFPRQQQLAALERELDGAGLIVAPRAIDVLWFGGPAIKNRLLTVVELSETLEPAEGLATLRARIDKALAEGKRVDLLEMYDTPPLVLPWKHLERLGYEKEAVLEVIREFPTETSSRNVHGYTLRSIVRKG